MTKSQDIYNPKSLRMMTDNLMLSNKSSSYVEPLKTNNQLEQSDRLTTNNDCLRIEISKHSYLIQGQTKYSISQNKDTYNLSAKKSDT